MESHEEGKQRAEEMQKAGEATKRYYREIIACKRGWEDANKEREREGSKGKKNGERRE